MSPRKERVFMVRMWLPEEFEGGDDSLSSGARRSPPGEWRGSVRDVSAERTYYVVGTREIADYIAGALNAAELSDVGALNAAELSDAGALNAANLSVAGALNAANLPDAGALNAANLPDAGALNAANLSVAPFVEDSVAPTVGPSAECPIERSIESKQSS